MSNHLFITLSLFVSVSLSFSAWHRWKDNARKISNSIEKLGTVCFLSSKFHTPWSLLAFTIEKNPEYVAGFFMILFLIRIHWIMATDHCLYSEICSWLLDLGKVNYFVNLHFFLCILFYLHSSVCWHAHEISFKKFVSHFSGNLLKKQFLVSWIMWNYISYKQFL